ncbi:O-antigen polymerase [Psychromonas sp. CNPT3]|nr:O-antigen polymerase [Psychromonas sp. CNPT3]
MIRITLLTFLIIYLSVYAWKNWFMACCWLILLMAVFQHPDMPKAIGGIPGLNHWNFLFINIVFSWLINRKKEGLNWEMPSKINLLLFFYVLLIFIGLSRYLFDMEGVLRLATFVPMKVLSTSQAINEYFINCIKWVVPALIIFDGCRTKKQYSFALLMTCLMLILLALQIIKAMKLGSLTMSGNALQYAALKVIPSNVGYHRVNMSMLMSAAFWMIFCLKEYVKPRYYWLLIVPACSGTFMAMVMTGGRTGYASWAVLGLFFAVFKWRKYIFLVPFLILGVIFYAPSAVDRFTQGMHAEDTDISQVTLDFEDSQLDTQRITSGRVIAWPLVWQKIVEAPYFGYGRIAMKNTGITTQIIIEHGIGESFPHPHNAYLEWLLDNGVIGAIPLFIFYLLILKYAYSLFREKENKLYIVSGGVCLAAVLVFLLAAVGSQTFYPREGSVAMWVVIALMLRVYVERAKVAKKGVSLLVGKVESNYIFKF